MIQSRPLGCDVLTAARARIETLFATGLPIYLAFSGGKDSLVLAHVTEQLVLEGRVDARQLHVHFVDEEAIFPCVEQIVHDWRQRWLALGAAFDWFCMEVRHFSCLNHLTSDESFICWDSTREPDWVRRPPACAVRGHAYLRPREDTYQDWLARWKDGPHMIGLRTAESVQRLHAVAATRRGLLAEGVAGSNKTYPLYDWSDDDVWFYLRTHGVTVPAVYHHLWAVGVPRNRLRVSQFFSIDTCPVLARVAEYYPDLMRRVLRREPNAYLVSLYWDSEMFRRRSATRRALEARSAIDYQARVLELLRDIPANFPTAAGRKVAVMMRTLLLRHSLVLLPKHYRGIYDTLRGGDPKSRNKRRLFTQVLYDFHKEVAADGRAAHDAPAARA